MKWINIQLQPEMSSDIDKGKVIDVIVRLGQSLEVSEGDDEGLYINLAFKVGDPVLFWQEHKKHLTNCPGFSEASIVTCEGKLGWDDYLLLHHFDPEVQCDDKEDPERQ